MEQTEFIQQRQTRTISATTESPAFFVWANRVALFVVFFWFGFLKIIHISPAETLVAHLHQVTIVRVIPIHQFMLMLGLFECTIGILWLFPKATKIAFSLFIAQMLTTFLPLLYLRSETWQESFALTLTGQYIVKNLVLIASALTVLFSVTKAVRHNR